jgi:hypothetical protein
MKNNIKKIIVFCLITLSSLNSFAQLPGSQNDTSNLETTDVPINDYIIPMIVAGVLISFYLFKKKPTSIKN